MARAFAQIEELQARLAEAEKRAAGPRARPQLEIARQLEQLDAQVRAAAQADIDSAVAEANERVRAAERLGEAEADKRRNAEAQRQAVEQALASERTARQQAEAKAQADQRARIEAEGVATKERLGREAAERKAKEMPMPVHRPPQSNVPPKPLAYTFEMTYGADGLIKSVTMNPV